MSAELRPLMTWPRHQNMLQGQAEPWPPVQDSDPQSIWSKSISNSSRSTYHFPSHNHLY